MGWTLTDGSGKGLEINFLGRGGGMGLKSSYPFTTKQAKLDNLSCIVYQGGLE